MTAALQCRTTERLAEIAASGLTRWLAFPSGVDLSSNDYLGLASDERLKAAAVLEINKSSVGSTGSRLLRGHRETFSNAERAFAAWKGTERSLFFSSGYQANLGVLQTFVENRDIMFSDELNHASLIDGIRLTKARRVIFDHCDVDSVAKYLRNSSATGQKFLITESLFSMEGDIAPLEKYAELCRETNTALIVDEAHAVGIFGRDGSGLINEFGLVDDVFLSVNTGGKALGVSGAFVAGRGWAIEYLLQKARPFIFSTAPSPMVPAALTESIGMVRSDTRRREKLYRLARYLREQLRKYGIGKAYDNLLDRSPIISIHVGDNERACKIAGVLQAQGYDVRAIRPPTVAEGTARLRVSINVSLTEDVLREFAKQLNRALDDH